MKSRQVSFFLLDEDYNQIEAYLNDKEIFLIKYTLPGKTEIITKHLYYEGLDELYKVFLFPLGLNGVALDYKLINTIEDPVGEFSRCYHDKENGFLRPGRLYFITHYFNEKKQLVSKDENFIEKMTDFLRWLKKLLVPVKDGQLKGYYVSEGVLNHISENKLQLMTL